MPWIWIVAGPNGSGKTSIARLDRVRDLTGNVTRLNADDLAKTLAKGAQTPTAEVSLQAADAIDRLVQRKILEDESFLVETVLSSSKYKRCVRLAKSRGFKVALIFVYTDSPILNAMRVKSRLQQSGHDVSTDKVVSRWPRSIQNFGWFANRADVVLLFDNSGLDPRLVLEKNQERDDCTEMGPVRAPLLASVIEKAKLALARHRLP